MNKVNNLIIFTLCLMLVGFFANFAQNNYGMELVVLACLGLSFLFFIKTSFLLEHKPKFKWLIIIPVLGLLLSFSMQFFFQATSDSNMHIDGLIYLVVFLCSVLSILLFTLVVIPIGLAYTERKRDSKTLSLQYFECIFSALFCFSIYLKHNHLMGAGVVLILSGFIVVPYFYNIIKLLKIILKQKNYSLINTVFLYLFLSFIFVGYIFKSQHWPGANFWVNNAFILLLVILGCNLLAYLFKFSFQLWGTKKSYMTQLLFVCFCITSSYMILRRNLIAPDIYSNEFPKAYQDLRDQANNITIEGKKFAKLVSIYEEDYDRFIHEQLIE